MSVDSAGIVSETFNDTVRFHKSWSFASPAIEKSIHCDLGLSLRGESALTCQYPDLSWNRTDVEDVTNSPSRSHGLELHLNRTG
jgi:hypothetical protein